MDVKGRTKIYKKEWDDQRVSYSRMVAGHPYRDGKTDHGEWIRAYKEMQFPRGANIPNKAVVEYEGFEAVKERADRPNEIKEVVTKYKIIEPPVEAERPIDVPMFEQIDGDLPY